MSLLILVAALAVGAPPATPPAAAERPRPASARRASDRDIELALLELHRTDPQRRVCVQRVLTGSRQQRAICGTVASWFNSRLPREVAAGDPPYQLVEEIKRKRRQADARRREAGSGG